MTILEIIKKWKDMEQANLQAIDRLAAAGMYTLAVGCQKDNEMIRAFLRDLADLKQQDEMARGPG